MGPAEEGGGGRQIRYVTELSGTVFISSKVMPDIRENFWREKVVRMLLSIMGEGL